MARWKLCFSLLLPLTVCFDSEETLVKTIGSEPDFTPICTNSTLNIVTLVVCKIRTERRREECRLLYQYGQDFVHECDSRFTLITENQTVFLHLTNLTSEDSGNYTCECTQPDGTYTLYLNVTVEDPPSDEVLFRISPLILFLILSCVVAAFITVVGVVLGCILRKCCRDNTRPEASELRVCEAPCSLDQDDPDDDYTSLQHPACDLYQTISTSACGTLHVHSGEQETDGEESDPSCAMYENMTEAGDHSW